MANSVKVNWFQLSDINYSETDGFLNSTRTNLFKVTTNKSTLDFGNVQAGKVTPIRCVVANFSGATQVSDLQFWLDSTNANASGSQNTDLSGNGWAFYYCIVPKSGLKFDITTVTEAQKKGVTSDDNASYLYYDNSESYQMIPVPTSVEEVSSNQFPSITAGNDSLVINLNSSTDSPDNDSHLILLDVQTPADANSGNTEGWYYRMNFLYN
jgi:hypothetical protein